MSVARTTLIDALQEGVGDFVDTEWGPYRIQAKYKDSTKRDESGMQNTTLVKLSEVTGKRFTLPTYDGVPFRLENYISWPYKEGGVIEDRTLRLEGAHLKLVGQERGDIEVEIVTDQAWRSGVVKTMLEKTEMPVVLLAMIFDYINDSPHLGRRYWATQAFEPQKPYAIHLFSTYSGWGVDPKTAFLNIHREMGMQNFRPGTLGGNYPHRAWLAQESISQKAMIASQPWIQIAPHSYIVAHVERDGKDFLLIGYMNQKVICSPATISWDSMGSTGTVVATQLFDVSMQYKPKLRLGDGIYHFSIPDGSPSLYWRAETMRNSKVTEFYNACDPKPKAGVASLEEI